MNAALLLAGLGLQPGQGQIDRARLAKPYRMPSLFGRQWDTQLTSEDVHRAKRQDAQPHLAKGSWRLAKPIDDLVDGAVATGGDDGTKTILHRLPGQTGGTAGRECLEQRHVGRQLAKPLSKPRRLVAAGGGIENQRDGGPAHFSAAVTRLARAVSCRRRRETSPPCAPRARW